MPIFTILEPLVADLIAADLILPHLWWDTLKVLRVVYEDALCFWFVTKAVLSSLRDSIAISLEFGYRWIELIRTQEVKIDKALSERGELLEEFAIASEWNSREVDVEELCVAVAVNVGV